MFLKRSQIDLAELPLEWLPLTRTDLFVMLGGCDSGAIACNVGSMDLARASIEKPWQGSWKENLVSRLHPSGWVDAEGNPNPELERALAPLRKLGLTITDKRAGKDRTMGVTMGEDGATGLVQGAPGIFNLRPFPNDRSQWPQNFCELFNEKRFPFQAATREWHERFAEYDTDPLFRALNTNNKRFVRNYSAEHGLDVEPMLELAHAVGSLTWRRYEVFVDDRRGCTMGTEYGWSNQMYAEDPCTYAGASSCRSSAPCTHAAMPLMRASPRTGARTFVTGRIPRRSWPSTSTRTVTYSMPSIMPTRGRRRAPQAPHLRRPLPAVAQSLWQPRRAIGKHREKGMDR